MDDVIKEHRKVAIEKGRILFIRDFFNWLSCQDELIGKDDILRYLVDAIDEEKEGEIYDEDN